MNKTGFSGNGRKGRDQVYRVRRDRGVYRGGRVFGDTSGRIKCFYIPSPGAYVCA
ncbi:transposase [Salmonella phage 37]|uniref:Transposase n=1 Tax=Salmonella phage 37 TaxID=1654890 RepID=A0A0N7CD78_9CAUD|nr:transposase [Salmonella phage 37]AKJ73962.1 transposase [Salmonella phage 37]